MSKQLTKRTIDALKPGTVDTFVWDGRGFGVKCTPTGTKTFLLVYRFPTGRAGKVRRFTIGRYGQITLAQATEVAQIKLGEIAKGIDPQAVKEGERAQAVRVKASPKFTLQGVAKDFIERYAKRRNRSWRQKERILNRVVPLLGGSKPISSITRADITILLDRIEDEGGPSSAEAALGVLRKMFNWHATRHSEFNTPFVTGMSRYSTKEHARDRVLSDDEIRIMWRALDACPPPFRQLTRFMLLTGQRGQEVKTLLRSQIDGDNIWAIPPDNYKTKTPHFLPLTTAALEQVGEMPNLGDYVFSYTGKGPFSNGFALKVQLDAQMRHLMAERDGLDVAQVKLKPWVMHDLRRTAKTLMSRVGIRQDHSERVLGHVIPGVAAVYDRHAYIAEKRHALNKLAAEVRRIVHDEPAPTVVHLSTRKAG